MQSRSTNPTIILTKKVGRKGRIIFYEEGGLKILRGGAHFFPTLKRGAQVFFPEFNIKYFFKKVCYIRNQSTSCTTEQLFVSLSNTNLQRFCLIH